MRRLFSQLLALNQSRAVFDLIIDCSHFTCGVFDSLADSWKMGEAVTTSASVNTLLVPTVTGIGSYYLKLLAPPPLARSSCSLTDLLLIQYSH